MKQTKIRERKTKILELTQIKEQTGTAKYKVNMKYTKSDSETKPYLKHSTLNKRKKTRNKATNLLVVSYGEFGDMYEYRNKS